MVAAVSWFRRLLNEMCSPVEPDRTPFNHVPRGSEIDYLGREIIGYQPSAMPPCRNPPPPRPETPPPAPPPKPGSGSRAAAETLRLVQAELEMLEARLPKPGQMFQPGAISYALRDARLTTQQLLEKIKTVTED